MLTMFFDFTGSTMPNPRFVAYKVVDGAAEEVFSVSYIDLENKGSQTWFVSFEYDDYTTVLSAGDVIYFSFADTGFFTNNWGITTFVVGLLAFTEETSVFEDGVSDGYFPIISNLPSVKQIDFLKALASMSGTFAVVKDKATIQFVSMDEVISNKSKALNWTRKVIASYPENKPKTISFSLDGFAQKNMYKWKEDDSVSGSYDGYIYVDDETIEVSKDSVTLPLAATEMRVDKAYIPLYEYGDNDEVGKLGKVEPRILLEMNNNGKSKATFNGLGWSTLLDRNYQSYKKVVRNPVIITERISISDIDLKELVDYAADRNVGIILWAGYYAFERDMENVCRHYAAMGVKGFKVDFMDRDDQAMVDFHYRGAEIAAKYHLMLDYHGTYKPTGMNRTYPNVINFEGVHGLEQLKFSGSENVDQVTYDVTMPFIRMIAGPVDYTQGAMKNGNKRNFRAVNEEPMSMGTRCRQLAEYVIFEAPLSMLCDSPVLYERESECTSYISDIPTVWDETRALNGKIGEYISMARRKGDVWYVGALTNWKKRTMEFDLSFLGEGKWTIELYKDGINADKIASDYRKSVIFVPQNRKLTVNLAEGGGLSLIHI